MAVVLSLTVMYHQDTGWTTLFAESRAISFKTEPPTYSHEWRKTIELLPEHEVIPMVRGLLNEGLTKHVNTVMRTNPF